MSIVTRTGDKGTTGVFGTQRVSKASSRIHACGTVDELNALLGLALAEPSLHASAKPTLGRLQHHLFTLGADLATPLPGPASAKRIQPHHTQSLEHVIQALEPTLPPLQHFILPGGNRAGSHLHLARTVCRRAERWTVSLSESEPVNPEVIVYLNRLGDLLFLWARKANLEAGGEEQKVVYEEEHVKSA